MRATRGIAVGALLVLALALAGCGDNSGDDGVATAGGTASAGSQLSDQDKALQYVKCVRDQGIQIGDPENGQVPAIEKGTVSETDLKTVLDKCRQYLPTNGKTNKVDAATLEKFRQLAQCMRDNGYAQFPDPDPDQGGISLPQNSGLDTNDPAFKSAEEKCVKLAALTPSGSAGGEQVAGS